MKKLRLEKKLTQLQLANMADVERNQIYRLEKGHHSATLTTIIQVALALEKLPRELHEFYHELPIKKNIQPPETRHGEDETTRLVRMLVYDNGFFDDEFQQTGDVGAYYQEEDKVLRSSAVSGVLHALWKQKVLERLPGKKKGTYKYRRIKTSAGKAGAG